MKKILLVLGLIFITACSGLNFVSRNTSSIDKNALISKYNIDKNSIKEWDKLILNILYNESFISDNYGVDNPINYLRRQEKMTDKDIIFLSSLKEQNSEISDRDYKKFVDLIAYYVKCLDRTYKLDASNIKDPKGLVNLMVMRSNTEGSVSNYIKNNIASDEDWTYIVALSQKADVSEYERKVLKDILNKFLEKENFFNKDVWINNGINNEYLELAKVQEAGNLTKTNINNINAKALYIAYPSYFSKLERWK